MLAGLRFLLNFQSQNLSVVSKTQYFTIEDKHFVFKHYCPFKAKSSKSIILFPGFSVHGYKDVRLSVLAKSIAGCGYNVFIPQIESIETLTISEDTLEDMAQIIEFISKKVNYAYSGKIGVLAPSFSGGMLLNTIAKNKLQHAVSSICTIGTFANLESTLSFILNNNQTDDYARNILLKNFIDYSSLPNKETLKNLLTDAIEDNGFKRKEAVLPLKLSKLDTDVKLQWHNLNQNIEFRKSLFIDIKKKSPALKKLENSLNVIKSVNLYSTPLVLIHGKNDDVIPSNESVQIHQMRSEKLLPTYLCITDLLSHGDATISVSKIKEIWHLAGAFSYFFKHAK